LELLVGLLGLGHLLAHLLKLLLLLQQREVLVSHGRVQLLQLEKVGLERAILLVLSLQQGLQLGVAVLLALEQAADGPELVLERLVAHEELGDAGLVLLVAFAVGAQLLVELGNLHGKQVKTTVRKQGGRTIA